jgi:spermidine synthase
MNFFRRWRRNRSADDPDAVYVTERFGVRSLHIGSDTVQSSMRLARPNDLELAYTRSMMAFLLFMEVPRRMLMIGLGGGSLAKFAYHRLPGVAIEVIEINARVVTIARQQFQMPPDDARLTVRVADGARCVAEEAEPVDVIAVDGYSGQSQAKELCSREFYDACRRRLAAGGIFVVNLWGSDRRFGECLARIEKAFPDGTLCLPAERPGNIIVFGFRDRPRHLGWDGLTRRAAELKVRYGLEFANFVRDLGKMNRCDDERLYIE